MATARIRIPGEPPSAAWTWEGADYVGFSSFTDFYGLVVADQECQQCTFANRTLPEFQTTAEATVWPDHDGDAEWLPDCHSDSDSEPLEYNSDSGAGDFDRRSSSERDLYDGPRHSDNDSSEQNGNHESIDTQYPLSELTDPEPPERLPHGSWHDGSIYYGGDCHRPNRRYFGSAFWRLKAPPEHIAASSCQNVQGINGHALSLAQMKNCRNIRFLMPKPSNWTLEASDQLLEESSLFYLSGETNGSNASAGRVFRAWRPFYPVRHGLQELHMDWLNVGEGCNVGTPDRVLQIKSFLTKDRHTKDYSPSQFTLIALIFMLNCPTADWAGSTWTDFGIGVKYKVTRTRTGWRREFIYGEQKSNEPARAGISHGATSLATSGSLKIPLRSQASPEL